MVFITLHTCSAHKLEYKSRTFSICYFPLVYYRDFYSAYNSFTVEIRNISCDVIDIHTSSEVSRILSSRDGYFVLSPEFSGNLSRHLQINQGDEGISTDHSVERYCGLDL